MVLDRNPLSLWRMASPESSSNEDIKKVSWKLKRLNFFKGALLPRLNTALCSCEKGALCSYEWCFVQL
jgi:hypothetical protein